MQVVRNEQNYRTYKWLIENMLYIVDKQKNKVRFMLNDIQEDYLRKFTERDIILKARQEGFSSLILAMFFIDCITIPYTSAVVITQDKDQTKRQLDRVHFYLNNMRGSFKKLVNVDLSSRDFIRFTNTGSTFYIGTAGSKSFSRGDTINRLHISEIAHWENVEVLTGLLEAVPGSGRIVIESTANGMANIFQQLWQMAKNGESVYCPHFYPWWRHGEYKLPVSKNGIEFTDDEIKEKDKYNLTAEQIMWRRSKIMSMIDRAKFPQEYPACEDESFLFSGRSIFDTIVLKAWLDAKAESDCGDLIEDEDGTVKFIPSTKGLFKIYAHPKPNVAYRIGADVAEGIENELKDPDYSAASVREGKEWEQVAALRGRFDVDIFAHQLDLLGRYYNNAKLGVERNSIGLAVLHILKNDCKYKNLYYREVLDEKTLRKTKQFGWDTNSKTKGILVNDGVESVRDKLGIIKDEMTLKEYMAFVRKANGRMEATDGSHDDTVISDLICIQMCKQTLYYDPTTSWKNKQFQRG